MSQAYYDFLREEGHYAYWYSQKMEIIIQSYCQILKNSIKQLAMPSLNVRNKLAY